jgi:ATP-dependent DNA ligase
MPSAFIPPRLALPRRPKHDGYPMMARRDPVGIRLITRNGHDWTERYPLVVEAVNHLKVRSCLIDGEAVCCDDRALTIFKVLCSPRYQPASHEVNVAFAARL